MKVIRGVYLYMRSALENKRKILEEQFEPTGWLLLSNKPWACFSSCKCLLNKISCGLMVHGGVKNTQNTTDFMEWTCPDGDAVAG